MNPTQPTSLIAISRKAHKRARAANAAIVRQAAISKGKERELRAPRGGGFLTGNRATKQRRLSGFAAMHTIRAHAPNRRPQPHPEAVSRY